MSNNNKLSRWFNLHTTVACVFLLCVATIAYRWLTNSDDYTTIYRESNRFANVANAIAEHPNIQDGLFLTDESITQGLLRKYGIAEEPVNAYCFKKGDGIDVLITFNHFVSKSDLIIYDPDAILNYTAEKPSASRHPWYLFIRPLEHVVTQLISE